MNDWIILCAGSTRPDFFFQIKCWAGDSSRTTHDLEAMKRALDFEIQALALGRDVSRVMIAADIGLEAHA